MWFQMFMVLGGHIRGKNYAEIGRIKTNEKIKCIHQHLKRKNTFVFTVLIKICIYSVSDVPLPILTTLSNDKT